MTQHNTLISALADEFDQMLRWHMTGEQYAAAILANQKESNPAICHTHDYIDSNESMIAAFQHVMDNGSGIVVLGDHDADHALMDAAWSLWKSRNRVRECGMTASRMMPSADGQSWVCTFLTADGRRIIRRDYADGRRTYDTINATYTTLEAALRDMR